MTNVSILNAFIPGHRRPYVAIRSRNTKSNTPRLTQPSGNQASVVMAIYQLYVLTKPHLWVMYNPIEITRYNWFLWPELSVSPYVKCAGKAPLLQSAFVVVSSPAVLFAPQGSAIAPFDGSLGDWSFNPLDWCRCKLHIILYSIIICIYDIL